MKPIKYYLFCSVIILLIAGCKDNIQSSIPNFPVYLELNLTSTYPIFKNSVNQCLLFERKEGLPETYYIGYGGILVCTGMNFDDSGNIIYYAFDMACPYEVKQTVRVYPNGDGEVICKTCGSVFDIRFGNGNPTSGPAKEMLKSYRASLVGDVLYVSPK